MPPPAKARSHIDGQAEMWNPGRVGEGGRAKARGGRTSTANHKCACGRGPGVPRHSRSMSHQHAALCISRQSPLHAFARAYMHACGVRIVPGSLLLVSHGCMGMGHPRRNPPPQLHSSPPWLCIPDSAVDPVFAGRDARQVLHAALHQGVWRAMEAARPPCLRFAPAAAARSRQSDRGIGKRALRAAAGTFANCHTVHAQKPRLMHNKAQGAGACMCARVCDMRTPSAARQPSRAHQRHGLMPLPAAFPA